MAAPQHPVIEMDPMDAKRAPEPTTARPHQATVPDVAPATAKHAGSGSAHVTADAVTKHDEARSPGGDLIAAIRAAPLGAAPDVAGDFVQAARDAKDVATRSQVFYAWALAEHRQGHDDSALRILEPVLRKDAGVAYQSAQWLKLRIVCVQKLDARCRAAAHDYDAAGGPNAEIAHRILVETQ
jgi:hypothetical protein